MVTLLIRELGSDAAMLRELRNVFPRVTVRFNSEWNEYQATPAKDSRGIPDYSSSRAVFIDKGHDKESAREARREFVHAVAAVAA